MAITGARDKKATSALCENGSWMKIVGIVKILLDISRSYARIILEHRVRYPTSRDERNVVMLNHVSIMGRLTHDPEVRRIGEKGDIAVCSFTIAVDRDFKDKETGERETDFIDCVAWRQDAEFLEEWFKQGDDVIVNGRLQVRRWTDRDENKRRNVEIDVKELYFGGSKRSSKKED